MRLVSALLTVLLITGCSSAMLRDEHDFGLFPTKIDIPSLEVSESVTEIRTWHSDLAVSDQQTVRMLRAVYEPVSQDGYLKLYTFRASDPLAAYTVFSALLTDGLSFSTQFEGYISDTEGILRRGTLVAYVSSSEKYPLSKSDIAALLGFVAKTERPGGEIFPPLVSAFSKKETPLRYSERPKEELFFLDRVYYGKSDHFAFADGIFCSRRDSVYDAEASLMVMMSNCRSGTVLLEPGENAAVMMKNAGGKALYAGRRGKWVFGISGEFPLAQGKKSLMELAGRLEALEKPKREKD